MKKYFFRWDAGKDESSETGDQMSATSKIVFRCPRNPMRCNPSGTVKIRGRRSEVRSRKLHGSSILFSDLRSPTSDLWLLQLTGFAGEILLQDGNELFGKLLQIVRSESFTVNAHRGDQADEGLVGAVFGHGVPDHVDFLHVF